MIDFTGRKHFFTDWAVISPRNAQDVTQDISPYTITVNKQLNQKNKKQEYVKGLGIISRRISYIPASAIDKEVINKLQTGDYVGIYSTKEVWMFHMLGSLSKTTITSGSEMHRH